MVIYHKTLASGRWFTFSLAEQLANIGSEFERALKWRQKKELDYFQPAFDRMLELFDLTIEDPRWRKTPKLKELCRLREHICEELLKDELPVQSLRGLQNYFFLFALQARANR